MRTVTIVLAAVAAAAFCAACDRPEGTQTSAVELETLPAKSNVATACPLHPVLYKHGRLKNKFLIGGDEDSSLKRGAVFAQRRIQINTDGAPNSYHAVAINADDPKVGAINIICNSGTKLFESGLWNYVRSLFVKQEPVKCYGGNGISVDPGYAPIYESIRANDWSPANGHRVEFNWKILAKKELDLPWPLRMFERARPCVTEDGFFVSKTALERHEPKESCDQTAYINANKEKAFVLPQHWFANWQSDDVKRWASFQQGDVVVAYRPADDTHSETWVYGIVGDAGPIYKFGEATLAFNWQLMRKDGDIRDQIRTYRQAIGLDTDMLDPQEIPVLILEGTAPALGGDYSPANVEARAKEEFERWGGEEAFKACLGVMK